jgi:hypothetical protein
MVILNTPSNLFVIIMSEDNPTFSEVGEQNIRERARREEEDEYPFQLYYVNERER